MSDETKRSLICDNCDKELITESSYPANYSLELKSINTNINNTGVQFGIVVCPPIDDTKHFCGLSCLKGFLKEK